MSLTKTLLVVYVLLATGAALAEPTQEWVTRYDGPVNDFDQVRGLAVDASGNVYVTGYSTGSGTYQDYLTIKYDADGDMVWLRRYNGPGNHWDEPHALAVDGSGNVYVTGESWGSVYVDKDYATIKYDADGDTVWVARYNASSHYDCARALAVDASGNVYVTGSSEGSGTDRDYATAKYDSDGNQLWVARYTGPGDYPDEAYALALDDYGNVYVTGSSYASGTSYGYATIKYDSDGDSVWVARYDGSPRDECAYALAVDASGNVYVTGYSNAVLTGYDYVTVKYNSNGSHKWVARYDEPGSDCAYALALDASGNVYVTGYSMGGASDLDYATIKYDSDGNQLWAARYNGPGNHWDEAYALALDHYGNVYVTGMTWCGIYMDMDYATVKYNSNGNQVWVARYDGPGSQSDRATALAVDDSENVYVAGHSQGFRTEWDYVTIKYSQNTGIDTDKPDNSLPKDFRLTCRPNPFNATTEISYTLAEAGEVKLTIHNLRGQLLETVVEDHQQAGEHQVIWDASEYSSGVYLYKLEAGDFVSTKKMNLLK